jgi:hypothetical protein
MTAKKARDRAHDEEAARAAHDQAAMDPRVWADLRAPESGAAAPVSQPPQQDEPPARGKRAKQDEDESEGKADG